MKYIYPVIQILIMTLLLSACKKEGDDGFDCSRFRQGVVANDKDKVAASLGGLLTSYSRENLNQLAGAVSSRCGINATVLCFDCVYTLPAQSELKISFTEGGTTIDKVLDISYSSGNKMRIVGMHD